MVFLVMLKTDGGGTATLACTAIRPDPVFPTKVVLENIQALSWPFQGMFLHVQNWSVERELVVDWKAGPLKAVPIITAEMVAGKDQVIPRPPDSTPTLDLGNPEVLREALKDQVADLEEAIPPPPEPSEGDTPPAPPPAEEMASQQPPRPRMAPIHVPG